MISIFITQAIFNVFFLETFLLKNTNTIIGCVYRHPSVDILCTLNDHYVNSLLEKLSKENGK